jgi:hypothetical protein
MAAVASLGGGRLNEALVADACEVERRPVAAPFGDAERPASEELPALIQAQLVSAPEGVTEAAGHSVQLEAAMAAFAKSWRRAQ